MSKETSIHELCEGTSSWNTDRPVNAFAYCNYRGSDGQIRRYPVTVAGDKITLERRETELSEA